MRIARLDLLRYGRFTDRVLDLPPATDGAHDLHIVLGPNEAGKSTTRQAIVDLLFGIPMKTRYGFLHGMPDMRLAARLEQAGAALDFQRRKGTKGTLVSPAGAALADTTLLPFLGATDRVFFERMFGLDHPRLVEGGSALLSAADDVGQMLFRSAAGLSGLGDVAQRLEAEADTLWGPRKKADRAYSAAADDLDAAESELKAATVKAKDWAQRQTEWQAAERAHEDAKALHAQLRQTKHVKERIRRSRPALEQLRTLHDQQLALGEVRPLPADAADRLSQAQAAMARSALEAEQHQAAQDRLQAEQAALHVDSALLAAQADIDDLHERRLRCSDHPATVQAALSQVAAHWLRAQALAQPLGWPAATEDELRARLPALPLRARLQSLKDRQATLSLELQHAATAHKAKLREAEALREQLRSAPASARSPALAAALAQARRLGDTAAATRQLQQAQGKAEQAEARAFGALRLGSLVFDSEAQLQAITLPGDTAARQQQADEQQDASDERAAAQAVGERAEHVAQLQLELQQFQQMHAVVERSELLAARAARDQLWQGLVAEPARLPEQAREFEGHLQRSDELADRRHDTARDASALQGRRDQLQAAELALAQAQTRLQAVQQARAARQTVWSARMAQAGVPGLAAEQLPEWRRLRQVALDSVATSAEAARAAQAHQAECEAAAQALVTTLATALPASTAADSNLPLLIEQAQALVQAADTAQGRRDSWTSQLSACEQAVVPLQETLAAATQSSHDWQQAWSAALREAALPGVTDVDEVAGVLAASAQIEAALQAMADLRVQRIDAPHAELETFAQRARALAQRLAPAEAVQAPEAIATLLQSRLAQARLAQAQAERLRLALQDTQDRLQAALSRQQAAAAELQPLLQGAGVADAAALALAVARSDEQRRLVQQREQAEQALIATGDGLTLAELRAEGQDVDAARLLADLDELTQQETEVVDRLGVLAVDRERKQQALDGVGGSSAAALAEAKRQDALARMTDAVERYVQVATAARLLRWAIERFRETQQGPMLAAASGCFQQLTGGSFERLVVDFEEDPPTLQGRRADGTLVGVEGMSDGTRDQLFLALRLAALDLHLEAGHAMPFIADDLFVNFDDTRSRAGLQALAALSRRTQVIYLTHHHHLADLARQELQDRVRVVEL